MMTPTCLSCSYCKEWRAKIEARIAELESKRNDPKRVEGFNAREKAIFDYGVNEAIDELRKLLE